MLRKIFTYYLLDFLAWQRINAAIAKGGVMMQARRIDLSDPATWEFSGFSQNGEDGIVDILRRQLKASNRFFVEIGAADGIENNSSWLAVMEKYNGLMVEGNSWLAARANRTVVPFSIGAECINLFVDTKNIGNIKELMSHFDPDVFSLDIDGNDYYIAQSVFAAGIRPKIFVVEYNSVFGPDRSLTIEYQDDFSYSKKDSTQLYYGVSLSAWKKFFVQHDYEFITVERNGVNAFFVDRSQYDSDFLENVNGLEFAENRFQRRKFRMPDEQQFELIKTRKFVEV
jgi:hypothetical protein